MTPKRTNIILIGMPGAGKSTIGNLLAKKTAHSFVDTDSLIEETTKRSLQNIVDRDGYIALRAIEEQIILSLNLTNHVIATGGSAAYSKSAMVHLKAGGVVVFLDVDISVLQSRIDNFDTRGLAKRPEQSFTELFEERSRLYAAYADITLGCSNLSQDEVCGRIVSQLP